MSPATPNILLGAPFIELSTIDSTNIYAMDQIKLGLAKSGSCYTADFQTNGKGQHGRVWESSKGQNLLCSYILELNTLDALKKWTPTDQIGFSAAIALGVRTFFAAFAGSETKIKKPNDIYFSDRKAGGILIENLVRGKEWTWTVIGIGMNINQSSFSSAAVNSVSSNPISLQEITNKIWDLKQMQQHLSEALSNAIQNWLQLGEAATLNQLEQYVIELDKK
ncbi:MAG: biotin--[acetyl-CoA-carboxylase] ligase [Chitinophagaceae bacterium]|nr:biotin--[acetyl-CoA-carboxylase] ligase [Chitinophagaceae bacterium]MCF8421443.1 biotin--[acetyl-CoA-carboxylase] ligase [Chitinophagaceae bacterium]